MDYRVAGELPVDWRVDGMALDMRGYIDASTTLWRWGTNYLKGKVVNEGRTSDADVTALFRGVGNAWKEYEDGRICKVDQTDCYTVRIHPTIEEISASSGYTSGGLVLKLEGTSLDAKSSLEVLVDGTPCRLLSNNDHEIYCETGVHEMKEAKSIYAGEHGLHRTMYNNTSVRPTADNLHELEGEGKKSILTTFEIP